MHSIQAYGNDMIRFVYVLFFILFMAGAPLNAADPQKIRSSTETFETAPVEVDGDVLFKLRGVSSLTAKRRARDVASRIESVALDPAVSVSDLKIVPEKDYIAIEGGSLLILAISEADAESEGISSKELLAKLYLSRIQKAIEKHRFERTGSFLLRQTGFAALAIALLAIAFSIGIRTSRRLQEFIDWQFQKKLNQIEKKSYRLLSAERMQNAWRRIVKTFSFALGLIITLVCIDFVLTLFPWTRPIARFLASSIFNPLEMIGDNIIEAFPGIVFIAILVIFVRYLLKLLSLFFSGIASGRITLAGFDQNWAMPTYRLTRIALIAFAIVIAYPYIPGSDSEAFKGISIFFGILTSIGSASIVANSLAGYALIYRKAFVSGDRVKIGDVTGDVVSMGQQATHLRTPKNEEVTIPSALIVGSHVINYSSLAKEKGLILHTEIGIGYEVPWKKVESMLLEAAKRCESILHDPSPFVLIKKLDTFCTTYELNAYSARADAMERQYHELHRNILDLFDENRIQIMTPAYEGDPEIPKVPFRNPRERQ